MRFFRRQIAATALASTAAAGTAWLQNYYNFLLPMVGKEHIDYSNYLYFICVGVLAGAVSGTVTYFASGTYYNTLPRNSEETPLNSILVSKPLYVDTVERRIQPS